MNLLNSISIFLFTFVYYLFFNYSFAQTSPSTSGYECAVQCRSGSTIVASGSGFGETQTEAFNQALANAGRTASTCFNRTQQCSARAVCLTGTGWQAADTNGFCPDPEDPEGDDEDNDGNDCDAGEENEVDCNDGDEDDTDSDGDGEPDSSDPDDGICVTDQEGVEWLGEGDVDPDCEDSECIAGEFTAYFLPFSDYTSAPSSICDGSCESGLVLCYNSVDGTGQECSYEANGNACESCNTPNCSNDGECAQGEQEDDEGNCIDIPNFCELDEDNDGVPDNQGTFACDNECDPSELQCEDAQSGGVTTYACTEAPPVCDETTDPVGCASLIQDYEFRCGGEISQDLKCEEEFVCELTDPALCALIHVQYLDYCRSVAPQEDVDAMEEWLNPTDALGKSIDSGENFFGGEDVEGSVIELGEIDYSEVDFSLGGSLDETLSINLSTVSNQSLDMGDYFDLIDKLGLLVVLSASIIAFNIVLRGLTS